MALFILITIDVIHVTLARVNHTDTSRHFLESAYRRHNLNFFKLKKLFNDVDTESNPWPAQNDCKSAVECPKKNKMFKGTAKKCDLSENSINIDSDPKVQTCLFNAVESISLDIVKPWSVTCPSTLGNWIWR